MIPQDAAVIAEQENIFWDIRVAIIHYWLVEEAGGEKVVEQIARIFPHADIFTLVRDRKFTDHFLPGRRIFVSFLQKIPGAKRLYRHFLPLMPYALEALDVSGYDLIISSESGPAKGIIPPLDAMHICYCHTPMRYLWDHFHEYRRESGAIGRIAMAVFGPSLRAWDVLTAARVDAFVANSRHTARRIARYYRREAQVIAPPVDIDTFAPSPIRGDYYLIGGRHVGYKRIDLAIAMANRLGRRLIVTGQGPKTAALKRMAGPTVEFAGRVPFAKLAILYAECRAFLLPGEEDFGIAPVEAMASGRPVIAYGRGGALDTVVPGLSGQLFDEQSVDGLCAAIEDFEATEDRFDSDAIRQHAERFSIARFRADFTAFVRASLQPKRA